MQAAGRRGVLSIVALLLASALAVLAAPAAGAPGAAEPAATLYLRANPDLPGRHNFTAAPPSAPEARGVWPYDVLPGKYAEWYWRMDRAPAPWTVEAGARFTLHVHFRFPDGTVPALPVPPSGDDPAAFRVEARLLRWGTQDIIAQGESSLRHPALAAGPEPAVVPLTAPAAASYHTAPGDAPQVMLQVMLHGLLQRNDPPAVLAGGQDAASRIALPGFPLAAFEAWEDAAAGDAHCHERLLQQRPCDMEEPAPRGAPEAAEAASAGVVALLALGLGVAGICAAARTRGSAAAHRTGDFHSSACGAA